nr:hypothetical protein [Gemmatimonadota bacterium]NIR78866.1 hypothetical protein [Gemmatimonadota bacterium]NIT87505.1 hypothetical protein [Gemmatimonadota bacterium]NIU31374.1 hypothetical protein [Gemmatimonadota bacterium]NIU36051.1 hypothetical protein [Gemmatimonadota bacterium]
TLASVDSIAQRTIDHAEAAAVPMLRWVLLTIALLGTVAVIGAVLVVRTLKGRATV